MWNQQTVPQQRGKPSLTPAPALENKDDLGVVESALSRLSDRYVSAKELLHGQLDACRVRGIVLTPSQGFARGMTVDEASGLLTERDGKTFYFCGEPCRQKFLSTPPGAKPEKKSGGCCG